MQEQFGVPPQEFGLHVWRISGATEASRTSDIPDRLIQDQGGWKSEVTMRRYTRDRAPVQARVSTAMMQLVESGKAPEFE